jgi:hypothetical protein
MAQQGFGFDCDDDVTIPNMPLSGVYRRSSPDAITLASFKPPTVVVLSRWQVALVCAASLLAGSMATAAMMLGAG